MIIARVLLFFLSRSTLLASVDSLVEDFPAMTEFIRITTDSRDTAKTNKQPMLRQNGLLWTNGAVWFIAAVVCFLLEYLTFRFLGSVFQIGY